MKHSNWKEPYKNHSEKNRALQNAKKNNKTTKKKSSDREGLAKSSKTQHSENTDKWHLWKACSWNANQNKTTRRVGYKKVYEPPPPQPKEAFRIKGALWNAEQSKNTNIVTTIARWNMAKEKAQKWTSQTGKKP